MHAMKTLETPGEGGAPSIRPLAADLRITEWRAWHVFVHHPLALERVLVDSVGPELARLIGESSGSEWFFIRYWENGPHIRLRVRGIDDAAFVALGDRLAAAARTAVAAAPMGITGWPEDMPVDGWHGNANAASWFLDGSVVEIAYEPEFRRYGGPLAMPLGESIFAASSRLALKVTAQSLGNRPMRDAVALALTAAAMSSVVSDETGLRESAAMMAANWTRFLSDRAAVDRQVEAAFDASGTQVCRLLEAALGRGAFPDLAQNWRDLLVRYVGALTALSEEARLVAPLMGSTPLTSNETRMACMSVIFSQMHMMNNRLGITPTQEYFIASIFEKALAKF